MKKKRIVCADDRDVIFLCMQCYAHPVPLIEIVVTTTSVYVCVCCCRWPVSLAALRMTRKLKLTVCDKRTPTRSITCLVDCSAR